MPLDGNEPSRTYLRRVVDAFAVPAPASIQRLWAGTGDSRKFVVQLREPMPGTDVRTLFLKCRARSESAVARMLAQHRIVLHVAARLRSDEPVRLAVPSPLQTRDGGTVLLDDAHAFELTLFLEGEAWSASAPAAREAGRALRALHRGMSDFEFPPDVMSREDDEVGDPTEHARVLSSGALKLGNADDGSEAGFLLGSIDEAHARLEGLGELHEETACVHGDFHPGNTRWRGDRIAGVVDFDCAGRGSGLNEAALAALHFAIDRGKKAMASRSPWPDAGLFEAFWIGYAGSRTHAGHRISVDEARCVPWLAVRSFARETLAGVHGGAFDAETISFATGVVAWLVDHAEGLGELVARIEAGGPDQG